MASTEPEKGLVAKLGAAQELARRRDEQRLQVEPAEADAGRVGHGQGNDAIDLSGGGITNHVAGGEDRIPDKAFGVDAGSVGVAADGRDAVAVALGCHRRRALGAVLLRLRAGEPDGQHPHETRTRRRCARRGRLCPQRDPARGSGFRFAAEAFAKVVVDKDFPAIARAAAASLDNAATLHAIGRSAATGQMVLLAHNPV
jgi:hypothetical protein